MTEFFVLRLVHVVGGMFWVGAGLFNFVWLGPALAQAGPAAGAIMLSLRRRRLFVVLPTVALLTILSGLRLMQLTSNDFSAAYFRTGPGATFSAAGAAAILAFLLGLTLAMPAQKRMAALGASLASAADEAARAAPRAEMARLQRRMGVLGPVVTALLVIAAVGMAVARYVG
ncbi:MAG TPA: hypothetical protein VMN78_06175 [Longimicrobiales bacterium]|nr:hypothetical protein [Longimicrobiales bacterium]